MLVEVQHKVCPKCFRITEEKDEIEWITVNGNHIPIKPGQDKEDAINDFLDKKSGKTKSPTDFKTALKSRGVKGDELLTQIDKSNELKDNGAKINDDGTVTVYHYTNKDAATQIQKTGQMTGAEDGIFFTTKRDGEAKGFGDTVLKAEVPIEKLDIDDLFGDEAHLRLPLDKRGQKIDVSKWLK